MDYFGRKKFHEVKLLGFQGIPGFISPFDEHLADRFIFSQAMDIGCHFESFFFQDALMGIVISAGHIVIGVVTGDHHHGHKDDILDALSFQLGNDRIQMGPAFDGIDIDIA